MVQPIEATIYSGGDGAEICPLCIVPSEPPPVVAEGTDHVLGLVVQGGEPFRADLLDILRFEVGGLDGDGHGFDPAQRFPAHLDADHPFLLDHRDDAVAEHGGGQDRSLETMEVRFVHP